MTQQHVPTKPTGCFLDYTYCCSPNCENDCGRMMSKEIEQKAADLKRYIAFSYFCGEPDNDR